MHAQAGSQARQAFVNLVTSAVQAELTAQIGANQVVVRVIDVVSGSIIALVQTIFPPSPTVLDGYHAFRNSLTINKAIDIFNGPELLAYGRPGEVEPNSIQAAFNAPPSPPSPPPPPPPPPQDPGTKITFSSTFSDIGIVVRSNNRMPSG